MTVVPLEIPALFLFSRRIGTDADKFKIPFPVHPVNRNKIRKFALREESTPGSPHINQSLNFFELFFRKLLDSFFINWIQFLPGSFCPLLLLWRSNRFSQPTLPNTRILWSFQGDLLFIVQQRFYRIPGIKIFGCLEQDLPHRLYVPGSGASVRCRI